MNKKTYSQPNVEVNGRRGHGYRIIVDSCPYCGKTHYHAECSGDDYIRTSDCFPGGEYKIMLFDYRPVPLTE